MLFSVNMLQLEGEIDSRVESHYIYTDFVTSSIGSMLIIDYTIRKIVQKKIIPFDIYIFSQAYCHNFHEQLVHMVICCEL